MRPAEALRRCLQPPTVRSSPTVVCSRWKSPYDAVIDFAIQAFDVHMLDYLLKPIDEDRLAAALVRARSAVACTHGRDFGQRLTRAIVRPTVTFRGH